MIAARALAAGAAIAVAAAAAATGLLTPVEQATVDARFAVRGAQPTPADVVVVGIDERSISELGAWPFRRRYHAQAVDRLRAAHPRAIVYDVQFTEPSEHPRDDLALYDALGRAGGAVLATGTSDAHGRTAVLGGDEALAAIHSTAAAANFSADRGGVIRRYPLRIGRLPSIAVATARRLHVEPSFHDDGSAPIDFRGPPGHIPAVSFSDVVNGRTAPATFENKVVVVGATAPTLQDRHAVATGGGDTMSGPELQASAIWTALHGNPLDEAPRTLTAIALALLGLAIPLASLKLRLTHALALAAALTAAYLAAAQLAFGHGLIVAVAAPLLALALGTLGTLIAGYAREAHRRRRAAAHAQQLEHEVAARTRELRDTQLEIVERLGRAAEHRDDETGSHLHRMSRLCGRLARAAGAAEREAAELEQASLLHDVGKIGIPDEILHKPSRLTPAERAVMQRHALIGGDLLAGSSSRLVQTAETIARTHHERWDGTGYPHGLRGEEIPLAGRIAALADVYDALLTERPYKPAWTQTEALAYIESEGGRHFDPQLAEVFVAMVRGTDPGFEAAFASSHRFGGTIGGDGCPRPAAPGRRRP
ncbi:MAG TPA: CHASE2 domain-containing protein [Solirubrobacter sp.]|nr:CHASE2 domain-containing protein [Solirubrobacter sp.]